MFKQHRVFLLLLVILTIAAPAAFGLDYVPGEVIVRYKGQRGADAPTRIQSKAHSSGMLLKNSWSHINMQHYQIKPGMGSVAEKIEELSRDPEVLYAEPNYILNKASVEEPKTEVFQRSDLNSFLQVTAQSGSFGMTSAAIQAVQAWSELSSGGDETVVAVIDTGVDYTHSVFAESGAIWSNPSEIADNGIDDDGNGFIDDIRGWNFAYNSNDPIDDDGHGTHVAGTILGVGQDIFADPLSAAKIRIMPLKFLDNNGSGTTAAAIQAINYAVNNGAKVLNNSWGGGSYSAALLEAIAYSYDKNAIFVAAAGNAGTNNDQYPMYPAGYDIPNVLAVAASTDVDNLAYFSNYGRITVDIGSPGVSILSTLPSDTFGYSSGTSMATPFVAGVAALIAHESPTMTGYQIRTIILAAADAKSGLSSKVVTNGRLNVLNSVLSAKSTPVSSAKPDYNVDLSPEDRSISSSLGSNGGGGCGRIALIGRGTGTGSWGVSVGFLVLFLMPLLVFYILRWYRSSDSHNSRRFDRFQIDTSVLIKVGGRELEGSVSCISLGGLKMDIGTMLAQGGVVSMKISSPDGREVIDVEGKVVWSENQRSYGIQFTDENKASSIQKIAQWSSALVKI